jgi:hypothetical protein
MRRWRFVQDVPVWLLPLSGSCLSMLRSRTDLLHQNLRTKGFVLTGKGRLGVAIRQLPVAAPCMQNEIAVTATECDA